MNVTSYGEHAIDLANTLNPASGDGPAEYLPDVAAAREFLAGRVRGAERADERDLEVLLAARARLREALAADTDHEAVEGLNDLLRQHPVRPLVSGHDGRDWHLHLADDERPPGELLVATATFGLVTWLLDVGMDRRGTCGQDTCDDVYVDTSRNHSRRYCSSGCSNRANVRAHRARKRGTDA